MGGAMAIMNIPGGGNRVVLSISRGG